MVFFLLQFYRHSFFFYSFVKFFLLFHRNKEPAKLFFAFFIVMVFQMGPVGGGVLVTPCREFGFPEIIDVSCFPTNTEEEEKIQKKKKNMPGLPFYFTRDYRAIVCLYLV